MMFSSGELDRLKWDEESQQGNKKRKEKRKYERERVGEREDRAGGDVTKQR